MSLFQSDIVKCFTSSAATLVPNFTINVELTVELIVELIQGINHRINLGVELMSIYKRPLN
jgi:hypothetical protein